jgi:hypothetical protein
MSIMLFILAASASASPLVNTRKDYEKCLTKLTYDMLKEKKSEDEFGVAAQTACEAEKAAFHAAVVKDERSTGSSVNNAKEFADEEVALVLEDMAIIYAEFVAEGSIPVIK